MEGKAVAERHSQRSCAKDQRHALAKPRKGETEARPQLSCRLFVLMMLLSRPQNSRPAVQAAQSPVAAEAPPLRRASGSHVVQSR